MTRNEKLYAVRTCLQDVGKEPVKQCAGIGGSTIDHIRRGDISDKTLDLAFNKMKGAFA